MTKGVSFKGCTILEDQVSVCWLVMNKNQLELVKFNKEYNSVPVGKDDLHVLVLAGARFKH